ncbi:MULTISPECIES: nucleoside/nucleotide kinase family protein [unclassified Modicisalibacter]|uniref:nucleoside/nucleotide kinase family protein n=1 Tax=unclassified Modicisalibacter TaxID=2679913 RepID=UPI001CCFDD31|nr:MULTISPECIES: nucleoside/nucleotide kinase family protein [unclassified Modicisalibacter]MBZ9559659.1 nucleoside/nucleotide kinase family protein [Modicisalibacter sp. R2A 31.J]MBZ9577111.1 nucleoside/nucleotide kinase family protein [Modicisalibacter sp. MOD 31.J]
MPTRTNLDDLIARLTPMTQGPERRIVALAGPPGAGKSYIAARLMEAMTALAPGSAEILPMDGFHYDDTLLTQRGDLARKGAPHTFDVEGLSVTLARIAADDGSVVAVPVFDRALEIARGAARLIGPKARLIVVEGNYLLLDDPLWARLSDRFDLRVFIQVPEHVLEERLTRRWAHLSDAQRQTKLEGNDLPNMRLVLQHANRADLFLENG